MNAFLISSIISAFITPIIGIRAIFKGEYKPQRMTRFVIWFISLLFVGTLFAQGDRNGIFIALVQLLSTSAIFFLSFKYGMGGTSKTDFIVLALALLAIYVWKTTSNPTLALYMSILADFIGFTPTLVKCYVKPYTEDWKFYTSDIIAGGLNLLSVSTFLLKDFAFPLYIFLINVVPTALILFGRMAQKRKQYD